MPLAGLSLVGFLRDEKGAVRYLQNACVPPADATEASLGKQWAEARKSLGAPIPNAGRPEIVPVPAEFTGYLGAVKQRREYADAFRGSDWSFQLVQIAPLLAYQLHVLDGHSADRVSTLKPTGRVDAAVVGICLPEKPENHNVYQTVTDNGVMARCSKHNVCIGPRGVLDLGPTVNAKPTGILLVSDLPFIEVARFNGHCYLRNGYHRAYGLAKKNFTHMPCVVRDVATAEEIGVRSDGSTLEMAVLGDAENRPTMGHFIEGRATAVQLRKMMKLIHITWSETVIPEE